MEVTQTPTTLERAEHSIAEGRLDEAIALLESLYGQVLTSSDRGRALALHVMCLEELGRDVDAERLIVDSMKEEGDDHALVLAAGMQFSEHECFLHAEVFLRNLCDLRPDDPVPWFNLAVTLGREGRYQEAIAVYDEAIRCRPDFADAHFQKGYCLSLMQDRARAAESYHRYLELEPRDGEAWQALGVVESDRGDYDAAYAAFAKAAELTSEPAEAYYNWAVTAVRHRDADAVRRCLEALQDIDPEDWRTLLVRADWEEAQDHPWPAWELLNEALSNVLETENADDFDPALAAYIAATILRFARRHDMTDHIEDVIETLFEHEVFAPEALEALRAFEGRFANQVSSYQVVLRLTPAQGDPYYVVYGVAAKNSKDAEDLASHFQARVNGDPASVWSVHALTEPDEGAIGVYWRSDEMDALSGGVDAP